MERKMGSSNADIAGICILGLALFVMTFGLSITMILSAMPQPQAQGITYVPAPQPVIVHGHNPGFARPHIEQPPKDKLDI